MSTRRRETEAEQWARMKREARELCEKEFEEIFGERWDDAFGPAFVWIIDRSAESQSVHFDVAQACGEAATLIQWLQCEEVYGIEPTIPRSDKLIELLEYLSIPEQAKPVVRQAFGRLANDDFLKDERSRRAWFFAGLLFREWGDVYRMAAILGVLMKKQNRMNARIARKSPTGSTIVQVEKELCRARVAEHVKAGRSPYTDVYDWRVDRHKFSGPKAILEWAKVARSELCHGTMSLQNRAPVAKTAATPRAEKQSQRVPHKTSKRS